MVDGGALPSRLPGGAGRRDAIRVHRDPGWRGGHAVHPKARRQRGPGAPGPGLPPSRLLPPGAHRGSPNAGRGRLRPPPVGGEMNPIRQLGELDPSFGWTGTKLITGVSADEVLSETYLRGAYASLFIHQTTARLVRDPMGLGKLFWAVHPDGTLLFSARPWRLIEAGCGFGEIRAVGPGMVMEIDLDRADERVQS